MIRFYEKHEKKLILLLWTAVILASIKSIFTDTGFDNAYTVAMSFRHLKGDGMFAQMWEPHQTSIFFTDFFMWIYHLFVPSYTGVMLYLQIVGTLFFVAVSIPLYRLLREIAGYSAANYACMFFIMFRAKQTPFPDFANLQIAFSVLLFLCLVRFIREQDKTRYLVLSAVFLCLETLAYPSCVLTFFPVIFILFQNTEKRMKNIGLFTGVCALTGGCYVGYFILKMGIHTFFSNLMNIFLSDSHSGEAFVSPWNYVSGLLTAVCWLTLSAVVAWAAQLILTRLFKRNVEFLPVYGFVLFLSELSLLFLQKKTGLDWTCSFYILPLLLMCLSCFAYPSMSGEEKCIWLTGNLLSVFSFLSTWLLTDLGLITMVSYMVLSGVVSLVALRHLKSQTGMFLFLICALVTVHRGLVVWGYSNKAGIWMVTDIDTIVRSGPSLGIVCDYMTYYQITYDREDHPLFVRFDDTFFLVGGWLIDPMEFLLTDADIGNYSTIDTPVYNEKLLDYLEQYPEKKPTVIAVSSWYGALQIPENTWIMNWIEQNYEPSGEGRYWRYYRAK